MSRPDVVAVLHLTGFHLRAAVKERATMVRLRIRELAEQRGLNITELSRQARIGYSTAHALWHDKPEI